MTALQEQVKPLLCEEGHEPAFEMVCEVPEAFQAFCNWPKTLVYHVCVNCHNTKLYFQKFSVHTRELTPQEVAPYVQ